ncbi:hypothetical protein D7S89_19570 [Trinickia fusca]|uniref:Uncharacterized protein n=1 Tax=Trinickia fusca TaxID=2419777 RepID=A0A494XB15_9BURK|nr:hypothetical protein D7S89_19570 [Trinickia fusca]
MYPASPYIYTPNSRGDNGPAIKSLLQAGYRWIQINGTACPILSRIDLHNTTTGDPYNGVIIEPAPGVPSVLIDVGDPLGPVPRPGIGRNRNAPYDPSYAAFSYELYERPASYLTKASNINDVEVFVADPSKYNAGDWIFISNESTNPSVSLIAKDGPMEVRQVLYKTAYSLILDRALKIGHPLNATASIVKPIRNAIFRGLQFTGNCCVGIHLHVAQYCTVENITSVNWSGQKLVLFDNGGSFNLLRDIYCTGKDPVKNFSDPASWNQNFWAVGMEGQDSTRAINCGGELCGNAVLMNYCIDTITTDARAQKCNINLLINWQSVRCGFVQPRSDSASVSNYQISPDCVDCYVVEPQPFA